MPLKPEMDRPISPLVMWLGSLVVGTSHPMTARSGGSIPIHCTLREKLGQVVHTPRPVDVMPQFGGPAH